MFVTKKIKKILSVLGNVAPFVFEPLD